jgi:hypothetical protein
MMVVMLVVKKVLRWVVWKVEESADESVEMKVVSMAV